MDWEPEACNCGLHLTEAQDAVQYLEEYTFEPLPSMEVFRLFESEGAQGGEAIQGRLIYVDPAEHVPTYSAISYAWGGEQKPHLIVCEGRRLPVTCNLFCALNRLRPAATGWKYIYFADAICIDQSPGSESKKERAGQVRLMNKIFTHATSVVVDLGPGAEFFKPALRLMRGLSQFPDDYWNTVESATFQFYTDPDPSNPVFPNIKDDIWENVMMLCSQPWFTRLWIVQEVVLAESAAVVTMSNYSSLQDLQSGTSNKSLQLWSIRDLHRGVKRASSFLDKLPPDAVGRENEGGDFDRLWPVIRSLSAMGSSLDSMMTLAHHVRDRKNPQCTMLRLLVHTQGFQKTDDRDTVYALIGLMSFDDARDVPVSYEICDQELSQAISRYLLQREGATWMLYYFSSCETNDLPSWMLDITKKPKPTRLACAVIDNNTAFATGCNDHITWWSNPTDDLLVVSGGCVDTIIDIAARYPLSREIATESRRPGEQLPEDLRVWFKETEGMISKHIEAFESSWESQISFRRTLICGGCTLLQPPIVGKIALLQHCVAHLYHQHQRLRPEVLYPDSWPLPDPFEPGAVQQAASAYLQHCIMAGMDQRLCVTRERRLALVPEGAQKDDEIAVFPGAPTPFVLRRHANGQYRLIGPAYVDGFMEGEAVESPAFAERQIQIS